MSFHDRGAIKSIFSNFIFCTLSSATQVEITYPTLLENTTFQSNFTWGLNIF